MKLNELERAYWQRYLDTFEAPPQVPYVYASIAGNLEIADQLLELYLSGKKTAGSSLLKDYQNTGDPLPERGHHWIVLDSHKKPRCILRTVRVETYRFDQVPRSVAVAEGEGDLSLDYWRKAHIDFFTPFLKDWGVTDLNQETLVVEFSEVVYRG